MEAVPLTNRFIVVIEIGHENHAIATEKSLWDIKSHMRFVQWWNPAPKLRLHVLRMKNFFWRHKNMLCKGRCKLRIANN